MASCPEFSTLDVMESSRLVAEILEVSGMSKAELSRRSGVSRTLIDNYLSGRTDPGVSQVRRLADAAKVDFQWSLEPAPEVTCPTVSEQFIGVLAMGVAIPGTGQMPRDPLPSLAHIWDRWKTAAS